MQARLGSEAGGGAWCPGRPVTSGPDREWLQVDLAGLHLVTAVTTQGRFANGLGQEYTELYSLEFWPGPGQVWVRYVEAGSDLLAANNNTYTAIQRNLSHPVIASKLRFCSNKFKIPPESLPSFSSPCSEFKEFPTFRPS